MSKTRRWEKPAPAGAPAQSQSPLSAITSFVDSLNEEERASHRAAYLHLMQALTGSNVTVDHTDGVTKLSGVLHAITPFADQKHGLVVKSCKVQREGSTGPNASDGKTAIMEFAKIVSLQNSGKLDLVSRNYSTEFATDSSIKKHGDMSHLAGRNLKGVDSSWLEASGDMSLEGKSSSGKSWDQFEANKRLFNVKDTYDENLYTKKLDLRSMTAEQIAKADRLAREIEGTVSSNIHLQEERGQAPEGDWDEEDRFSGVLRSDAATTAPKKATAVDATNPWKRGAKLTGAGASGAASPATPATLSNSSSATNISTKAPLTPPPGVTLPGKKGAAAVSPVAAATADVAAPKTKPTEEPEKAEKAAEKTSEKKVEPAPAPAVEEVPVPAATTTTAVAADPSTPEVKAAPVKKLNAGAAEFKPSWMASPAPAAAPATPVVQAPSTPQQVPYQSPQQFTPNHGYNNGGDMYNKQVHSPSFVPHNPEGPYGAFDPNNVPMGMMQQPFIPNSPQMFDPTGNAPYFLPPQVMMQMPAPHMDYLPNGQMMPNQMMPMQMMPYPPMQQNMPMQQHEMYMQGGMPFQGGMNMGMMQPNHQMGMYPQQQGGYNNMGSGQKPKYNNDIRNNNQNKGGRGMGGGRGGYNNNNNAGRGYGNSPQQGGLPPPTGPSGTEPAPDTA